MIRQRPQLEPPEWDWIVASDAQVIHYFNEPERDGISPELAAQKWNKQVIHLRRDHGKKIVSPSCASDPPGTEWLKQFMFLISDNPPDYVGVHYYGTVVDECKKYIQSIHELYLGIPLIVSEIASISRDKDEVYEFTKEMANWLDETEYIFEYAFFGCMKGLADDFVSPQARLMDEKGEFTELMEKLMVEQPVV